MNYLLRCNFFSGFGALTRSLDADPSALLAEFELPEDLESRPEQFVPFRRAAALFEYCARHLGCPDFGIQLAGNQGINMLGPVAVLVRNAQFVSQAYEAMARYMHVVAPGVRISYDRRARRSGVRLYVSIVEERLPHAGQIQEMVMASGTQIGRMLVGELVSASCMTFQHRQLGGDSLYRRAYGCEVRFDQDHCAVEIPWNLMRRRVIGADSESARIASEYLRVHHLDWDGSLVHQVRDLVNALLPTGQCNIDTIAAALGQHPRTLQRRLSDESVSASEIVDAERRKLTLEYLSHSEMQLSQIVGLLGYSNQSAFNRSCQRWFGSAPGLIRTRLHGGERP